MIACLLLLLFLPIQATAREPTLAEVQQKAVQTLGIDRWKVDKWEKKARWAAALPRFQVGFDRDLKDTVALTTRDSVSISGGDVFVGPDENNFDQNFNEGISVDVRAVWFLGDLIFNRESLAASGEYRDWNRERTRAIRDVTEAYLTRTRLLKDLQGKTDHPEMWERKRILLDQACATLDAYTTGWFSGETEKEQDP